MNKLIQPAPVQSQQKRNAAATNNVITAQSLCNMQQFDLPTQLEIELWQNWKAFVQLTQGCQSQSERLNVLQRAVSQSDVQHSKLIGGMLFAILVTPGATGQPAQHRAIQNSTSGPNEEIIQARSITCDLIFSELNSIVRDHYKLVVYLVCQLTHLQFPFLKQQTVERMLWMTEQLILKAVPGLKELVVALMQQISVSRSSSVSFFLNQRFADLLCKHVDWVCSKQTNQAENFASMVFLKFLRQAEEHYSHEDKIRKLRDVEINLCLLIWERRQAECTLVGKELVRIFGNLSGISKLQPILNELKMPIQQSNPLYFKFAQHFSNEELTQKPLLKLMLEFGNNRSSQESQPAMRQASSSLQGYGSLEQRKMYLSLMVPTEVQRKIEFMLSQVPEQAGLLYSQWLLDFAGVKFGTESESLLIDLVRFIVVNVQPTNEVIHSSTLQRFTLIGHFIAHQKHQVHKSWVLQALFIDWLYYQDQSAESIMLVEPGMLLIYRSAQQRPWLTDMLVEFLDNYVRNYDPQRTADAMLSVQAVMLDCERKGVVKSIVEGLVNQPTLQVSTQQKIKQMYRASDFYSTANPAQKIRVPEPIAVQPFKNSGDFEMQETTNQAQEDDFAFADEEEGIGEFSPPHEPPAAKLAANVPVVGFSLEQGVFQPGLNQMFQGQKEQPKNSQYKIDLFVAGSEPQNQHKEDSDDKEMSSGSSSEESSSSEDQEESPSSEEEKVAAVEEKIEVPKAVLLRFFSSKTVLEEFLQKRDQKTLFAALDDFSGFYVLSQNSASELTELAYIMYQCYKDSIMNNDMLKFASKWKNLEFTNIFRYLAKVSNNQSRFALIANFIKTFAQFDLQFELKMTVHFMLENVSAQKIGGACLQKYAQLIGDDKEYALRKFVNNTVLKELISTVQYKFLNFTLSALIDLAPAAITDNVGYLEALLVYGVPSTVQKVTTQLRLNPNQVLLFSGLAGLRSTLSEVGFQRSYLYQRTLWTVLRASALERTHRGLIGELTLSQVICEAFLGSARALSRDIAFEKQNKGQVKNVSVVSELSGSLIGLQEFVEHYVQTNSTGKDTKQAGFMVSRNVFENLLNLYAELDKESTSIDAAKGISLKPLMREVAQTILCTLFQAPQVSATLANDEDTSETQKLLIAAVIQGYNEALSQSTSKVAQGTPEQKKKKKEAATGRLRAAKEIFSSKLSAQCVQQAKMQDIVNQLTGIEIQNN